MCDNLQIRDLTSLAKRKTIPISVLVEVCYTCNQDCIHCCLSNHSDIGMSLDQYEHLLDQLVEAQTFFIILTGGEPFFRSDFMEIVRAARKRRLSVSIFSNGTLLNKNIIAELSALCIQEIHISVYAANPNIHDAITRIPGSFEKSIDNIKMLISSGVTTIIKCPLMNINVMEVDSIKKLARDLGTKVEFTTLITARNNGDSSTHRLRLTTEQLRRALADPHISLQSKTPIYFKENIDCIPCDTVLNGGSVDPHGNVYFCNQLPISGGNVLKTPFIEVWRKSLVFKEIRAIRLYDLRECRACDLFQFCTRCPGLAFLEDGDLYGCSSAARIQAQVRKELGTYPTQSHIFSKIWKRRECL